MSVLAVDRVCRRLVHDRGFRAAMQADPAAALAGLDVSEAERAALLAGDVAALYRMGVNAYLMGYLVRYGIAGLTLAAYNARMRALAGEDSASQRS